MAGNSVPSTAATAGNYYRITSAGTSQSKTWAAGDVAIYNGTSGSWTQIAGGVTDPTSLANRANSLAARGGVVFTASGGRATVTLGQAIGSDPLTVSVTFRVPVVNPDGDIKWLAVVGTEGGAATLSIYLTSSGVITAQLYNGAGTSDRLLSMNANAVTTYGGKIIRLDFTRSSAGASMYVNGVSVAATGSTSGGSPPAWDGSITSTKFFGGSVNTRYLAEAHYDWFLANLALTAGDILECFELGGAIPERFKWGSQSSLITGDNSTFASDAGYWTLSGATISGGTANITGSGSYGSYIRATTALTSGKRYRVAFTVVSNTGSNIWVGSGSGTQGTHYQIITGTGAKSAEFEASGTGFGIYTSAGTDIVIDDLTLVQTGVMLHWPADDGLGYQLRDESTNRLHAWLNAASSTHALGLSGPGRVRTTSNTNGNQQLLGGTAFPSNVQLLRARARALSGTPTAKLGSSSGGSDIVASVALSTAWKNLTLAVTDGILGTGPWNLWAGSNSTDVIEWDIAWEPLSA